MLTIKSILVPSDFSDCSDGALRYALALMGARGIHGSARRLAQRLAGGGPPPLERGSA